MTPHVIIIGNNRAIGPFAEYIDAHQFARDFLQVSKITILKLEGNAPAQYQEPRPAAIEPEVVMPAPQDVIRQAPKNKKTPLGWDVVQGGAS